MITYKNLWSLMKLRNLTKTELRKKAHLSSSTFAKLSKDEMVSLSKCVVECDERCTKDFEDFVMDDDFINWHFKPSYLDSCLNCPATNVCGGPCSVESLLTDGDKNMSKCQFMNSMLKWVLENDK